MECRVICSVGCKELAEIRLELAEADKLCAEAAAVMLLLLLPPTLVLVT